MNSDWLAPLTIVIWGAIMASGGFWSIHQLKRLQREEDEQFYREIYGPAGKPAQPATAEPQSPKQSAE